MSIVSYEEYEPVFQAPEYVVQEQRSFSQNHADNVKDYNMSNSQNMQSKSKMMHVDSCYQNTVADRKSLQFTSVEPKYISHKVAEQKSMNTISAESGALATWNEISKSNKTIEGIVTTELTQQEKDIVRSCDRMGESLKNHINTFKEKVFNSKDIIFSQDRNLISNNHVQNSQGSSQYLDSLQSKHRRGTDSISIRQPQKNIKASAQSKIDIRENNRINTSNGARSKINFERESYNDYNSQKRWRTAAFNSRMNYQNKIVIDNAEEELKEIMDSPCSNTVHINLQTISPQQTRPSTIAQ